MCTSTGLHRVQRRVDTTTRGSLEVAEDVVAKPLHNIHVRVRSRHASLHAPQIHS